MRRWAVVDRDTGIIQNIVIWDGETLWEHNIPNVDLVECGDNEFAEPGGKYENGVFMDREQVVRLNVVESAVSPTVTEVTSEPTVI